jgi:acetoin utilization deacetylase AcuC-like enzyme
LPKYRHLVKQYRYENLLHRHISHPSSGKPQLPQRQILFAAKADILIVDCDVHQGDGTAATTKDDPSIFTFSIHGKNNFPYHKETSDLDIELENETDDRTYLGALENGLTACARRFEADLVVCLPRWG